MDGLVIISLIISTIAIGQILELRNRIAELEKPIKEKKAEQTMITRTEVLSLIEKSKKG